LEFIEGKTTKRRSLSDEVSTQPEVNPIMVKLRGKRITFIKTFNNLSMNKLRVNFRIEEEELVELIKEINSEGSQRLSKLKAILTGVYKFRKTGKPKVRKPKKIKEVVKKSVTNPYFHKEKKDLVPLRETKYIVDYYNAFVPQKFVDIAEEYRKELKTSKATESEIKFKAVLKSIGVKYEYQHIIFVDEFGKFFILDFYLPDYNIGIEIDGGYHFTHEQMLRDSERTKLILRKIKIRSVLRFTNNQVEVNEYFLNKVKTTLETSGLSRMNIRDFGKLTN